MSDEAEAPAASGRRVAWTLSWPLLVGLGWLVRALATRIQILNDPDTYLHIAAGRWILAHHALPVHDPFSHSMPGAAWVPHEWLSEVVLAIVYDLSGWSGVVTVSVVCFALAAAILTRRLLDRFEPITGLIAALVGATLVLPHLLARAHILALPLLVIWCAGVIRAADDRAPPPWRLLPAMLLWANLHGSYLFGLALTGYLGLEAALLAGQGERWTALRRWGLFLAAATLAALVTPNGIEGLITPFRLLGMPVMQSVFIEWQPPDFTHPQLVEGWILLMLFVGLVSGLKLPPLRVLVTLGLLHLAIRHVRHADLLGLVTPLVLAASMGPQLAARVLSPKPSSFARFAARLARPAAPAGIALALVLGVAISALSVAMPISREDSGTTPGAALAAARRMHLDGPVFNDEGFGGYLVFEGVPTFIDGRIEMYGDAFLKRYLDADAGKQPALDDLLAKYHIAWTLLPPSSPAVAALEHMTGWRRAYADKTAVIDVRTPPPG